MHLIVLSVDIIFGDGADMARKATQKRWVEWMALGCVLAVFAGPPCETFSIARGNVLQGVRIRPVRSASQPSLSIREASQVLIGNLLVLLVLEGAVLQAAMNMRRNQMNYDILELP